MKPKYVKHCYGTKIFYVRDEVWKVYGATIMSSKRELIMLQWADFCFDQATNTLIKCREDLETILDGFLEGK